MAPTATVSGCRLLAHRYRTELSNECLVLGVNRTRCAYRESDEFDPVRKWSVHCSGRDYADCVRLSRKIAGRHRRFDPSFIDTPRRAGPNVSSAQNLAPRIVLARFERSTTLRIDRLSSLTPSSLVGRAVAPCPPTRRLPREIWPAWLGDASNERGDRLLCKAGIAARTASNARRLTQRKKGLAKHCWLLLLPPRRSLRGIPGSQRP